MSTEREIAKGMLAWQFAAVGLLAHAILFAGIIFTRARVMDSVSALDQYDVALPAFTVWAMTILSVFLSVPSAIVGGILDAVYLYIARTLGRGWGWGWFVFVIAFLVALYLVLFVGVALPAMNIRAVVESANS